MAVTSQYIHISDHYGAHFKLIQLYCNKIRKKKIYSYKSQRKPCTYVTSHPCIIPIVVSYIIFWFLITTTINCSFSTPSLAFLQPYPLYSARLASFLMFQKWSSLLRFFFFKTLLSWALPMPFPPVVSSSLLWTMASLLWCSVLKFTQPSEFFVVHNYHLFHVNFFLVSAFHLPFVFPVPCLSHFWSNIFIWVWCYLFFTITPL